MDYCPDFLGQEIIESDKIFIEYNLNYYRFMFYQQ